MKHSTTYYVYSCDVCGADSNGDESPILPPEGWGELANRGSSITVPGAHRLHFCQRCAKAVAVFRYYTNSLNYELMAYPERGNVFDGWLPSQEKTREL